MTNHTQEPNNHIIERVFDPKVLFVSLADAATLLGIAKSTAHNAVHQLKFVDSFAGGKLNTPVELCPGLPVHRIGRRYIVSTLALRNLYGATQPAIPEA